MAVRAFAREDGERRRIESHEMRSEFHMHAEKSLQFIYKILIFICPSSFKSSRKCESVEKEDKIDFESLNCDAQYFMTLYKIISIYIYIDCVYEVKLNNAFFILCLPRM